MPVVVTRPAPEASRWLQALAAHRIEAIALPLIAIAPAPDAAALRAARERLATCRAVMFVSGNAARGLLAGAPAWPVPGPRAWATGPGTADALRALGVPAACIDQPPADAPQFDSEALWAVVAPQVRPGDRVLVVRGAGADGQGRGRDWLAVRLMDAGAEVSAVLAYARSLPDWSASERARARQALADGSLWLLSSSEAVHNLLQLLPGDDRTAARALATHPRIAAAARAAGFGDVRECRPGLADVVASIESTR